MVNKTQITQDNQQCISIKVFWCIQEPIAVSLTKNKPSKCGKLIVNPLKLNNTNTQNHLIW